MKLRKHMYTPMFVALVLCCNKALGVDITDWSGLNTTDNIKAISDITVSGTNGITLNSSNPQTIDGQNHSLTGGSEYYFTIQKANNLTIKNFGSISDGTSESNTFAYTDKNDNTIYKTIDKSVNSFSNIKNSSSKSIFYDPYSSSNSSTITFDNNVFANNSAYQGGVMSLSSVDNVKITNSIFYNNSAKTFGGALYINNAKSLDIESSEFLNNTTNGGDSAAAYIVMNSKDLVATIKDSIFENNNALNGNAMTGGALKVDKGVYNLDNLIFKGNNAASGAGVYISSYQNTTHITNSLFDSNTSTQWAGGAGYVPTNAVLTVDNTIFKNNKSTNGNDGGALEILDSAEIPYIKNSQFLNNEAGEDGGAINSSTALRFIENSTFDSNKSSSEIVYSTGGGGAIWWGLCTNYVISNKIPSVIYNSIFSNNFTKGIGGAIFMWGNPDTPVYLVDTSFTGNHADNEGGAIYTTAKLSIFADKKDVLFQNNTTNKTGADIYFDMADVDPSDPTYNGANTIELNASEGRKIVFDDGIVTNDNSDDEYHDKKINNASIDINKSGLSYNLSDGTTHSMGNTGEIQFNNNIEAAQINLYGGTLSIGQNSTINSSVTNPDGFINNSNLHIKGDSIVNTINGVTGTLSPQEFIVDSGVNWQYQFDADLNKKQSDKLVVTENNGNLSISKINLITDTAASLVKITYSNTNINGKLADNYTIGTSTETYTVTAGNDDTGSYLWFKKGGSFIVKGGLANAINSAVDSYSNTSKVAEDVSSWVNDNSTIKHNLIINGNGQDITTQNNLSGIIVPLGKTLTINNVTDFTKFNNAITNTGTLNINDTSFTANSGSAIVNNGGTVNIAAANSDIKFENNTDNDILSNGGEINVSGSNTVTFNDKVTGSNNSKLNLSAGQVKFNGQVSGVDISQSAGMVDISNLKNSNYEISNGVLNIKSEADFIPNTFTLNGGNLNIANNSIGALNTGNIMLNGITNISVDADLVNNKMDRISATSVGGNGTINVSNFNLMSDTEKSSINLNFADADLRNYITTNVKTVLGPIYKYNVAYDKDSGNFIFAGGGSGSGGGGGYNPSVMASSVSTQLGGYYTQLSNYEIAMHNMDLMMIIANNKDDESDNKYAYMPDASSPVFNLEISDKDQGTVWMKPYTTFETVHLKHDLDISNVLYGTSVGVDSAIKDLKDGYKGIFSGYLIYSGSHQSYSDVSTYQNGVGVGFSEYIYKGNFYSGTSISVGASIGEASTMFGNESFTMLMAGIVNQTVYNWKVFNENFIIQPRLQTSYTFVNTFDYTSASGVKISSDPLNAVLVSPGIRFILNKSITWKPYATFGMVFNFMNNDKFLANQVQLPSLSIKPYFEYGLGIQKQRGEKLTGYAQVTAKSGGRTGISVQLGFEYKLGKNPKSPHNKELTYEMPKKVLKSWHYN